MMTIAATAADARLFRAGGRKKLFGQGRAVAAFATFGYNIKSARAFLPRPPG
jgi:hypothetical protein